MTLMNDNDFKNYIFNVNFKLVYLIKKMVLINKTEELEVYNIETVQNLLNRIALMLNTLPKYLYFPDGVPSIDDFNSLENIMVEDLLVVIVESDINFENLYKKIENKISQQKLDLYLDIFLPFISFNSTLDKSSSDVTSTFLLFLAQKLKTFPGLSSYDLDNLDEIYRYNKNKVIDSINEGKSSNKLRVTKDLNLVRQLISIPKGIQFTNFECEKISVDFTLNITNVSLVEIFNSVVLTPYVPFASVDNYFKILKDFLPSEDWSYNLPNIIIFKVLQKIDVLESETDDYVDIFLTIDENDKVIISLSLMIGKSYLSVDELIMNRFIKCLSGFNKKVDIIESEQSGVNGVFYLPQMTMNRYVFSDIIINNPVFSAYMSIDESIKATKQKGSLYVHFSSQEFGELAFNITEKVAIKNDANLKNKDIHNLFKIGSKYVRVKISYADTLDIIEGFQELFSKLYTIYLQNFDQIKQEYEQFLPDLFIEDPEKVIERKELKLKDIAPEVFVGGYPQKCLDKPNIILDDEVDDAEQAGKIVMRYPRDGEGFPPRNYICNHKDARFPGLRENPLSNKERVPFLPCCYKKNQSEKSGSIFRHYFYEEDRKEKDDKQQNFIKTNKFVQKDKYGELIGDVNKIFEVFDASHEYMYLRKGVSATENSFLECVLEAMQGEITKIEEDDVEQFVKDIREEIGSDRKLCNVGKQEMYDYSIEEINKYLLDNGEYLNPELTISILERFFNCNIYVFNRYGFKFGKIVKPRHLQSYYRFLPEKTNKSVFIYEHSGSTSDHAKNPRCELIVKWKVGTTDDIKYSFDNDSDIVNKIENLYFSILKSYSLNKLNHLVVFPLKLSNTMKQSFDSYGKTRMIKFNYEGQTITFLLSGVPCLTLESTDDIVPTSIEYNLANKIIKEYNLVIKGKTDKLLVLQSGNVDIMIPVSNLNDISKIPMIDINTDIFPDQTDSNLFNFNKYKKIARYVIEYSYWIFSEFYQDKYEQDLENVLIEFAEKKIEINPDFEYLTINKYFSMDSPLLNNNKLVVKSEEALKRLIYNLRVALRNNMSKIKNYYKKLTIDNFYVEVSDFDRFHSQVILYGKDSVIKWLNQQNSSYDLSDSVIFTINPYFFKNTLVGNKLYLAQNTSSIEKAKEIALKWHTENYNVGFDPVGIDDKLEFEFYRYGNSEDIKKYNIVGESNDLEIKVLGYKVGDVNEFTVLLKL